MSSKKKGGWTCERKKKDQNIPDSVPKESQFRGEGPHVLRKRPRKGTLDELRTPLGTLTRPRAKRGTRGGAAQYAERSFLSKSGREYDWEAEKKKDPFREKMTPPLALAQKQKRAAFCLLHEKEHTLSPCRILFMDKNNECGGKSVSERKKTRRRPETQRPFTCSKTSPSGPLLKRREGGKRKKSPQR